MNKKNMRHKYYSQFYNVFIHYNNETGDWLWSIVSDFPGFWVDSFKTKQKALDICEEFGYNVIEIIIDEEV